jgi:hypothetical protein
MNSSHLRSWAGKFARRLVSDGNTGATQAVRRAYALALARPPSATELATAAAFIESQTESYLQGHADLERSRELALTDFAQAILCLNEFIYLE